MRAIQYVIIEIFDMYDQCLTNSYH